MKIKEMEALLKNFSNDILKEFETTQQEFKTLTVQKGLKFLEANKFEVKRAKEGKFWNDYQSQMEKYISWFKDEIIPQNPKATKDQKTEMFFKYVDKKSI